MFNWRSAASPQTIAAGVVSFPKRRGLSIVRYVYGITSALLAGGLLAFALSFDEVIVTTFTAGQQTTLPIWMLQELIRPRQRPVTNVVAVLVIALTFVPILLAYLLTRADEPAHR